MMIEPMMFYTFDNFQFIDSIPATVFLVYSSFIKSIKINVCYIMQ